MTGTSKRACWKSQERCPERDGDFVREYKATHEDNFLSSWLWDDTERKATEGGDMARRTKGEDVKSGRREVEEVKERDLVGSKRAGVNFSLSSYLSGSRS